MNTLNKFFFLLIIVSGLFITSCVDNDFDEPENTFMVDANNVVTIESILSELDTAKTVLLTEQILGGESKFLKVTVTADDASGNLFKIIFFEDESAALSIIPDRNELNSEFSTGAVIYVKLNGLTISNAGGTPQLGYGLDDDGQLLRIPDLLVSDFMFLTNERKEVTPQIITIADYKNNENLYINRLVTIENVEFTSEFAGGTYAITNALSGDTPESINAIISDCENNTLIVRNSGFSDFAGDLIPNLNGSITGVLSKFDTDLQLFLRDKNDVVLNMPRCLDGLGEESIMKISELVNLATDDFLLLDENSTGKETAYIRGTVIADDKSGTFFKTLIVQDESAGIRLSLDAFDLYESYPIGTEVLVSLNGLTLKLDAENPSIGDGATDDNRLARIDENKVSTILINTSVTNEVQPIVTTIDEVIQGGPIMLNRLVMFDRVELPGGEVGNAFAEESRNITMVDCDDESIILRTSSFADFANELIPNGSGNFTGVTGRFLSDVQIFLRTRSDLDFNQDRCDGSGGEVTNEITIESIKNSYYNLGADSAEEGFITGTVISNRDNITFQERNIVIQNGNDGIVVRFNDNHSFEVGSQLKINVTQQEVSEFNGLLQIANVPNFNAEFVGSGSLPAPTIVTVEELLSSYNDYESTLINIVDADLFGGSTFGDSPNIDDGTASIQLFTKFSASFANEQLPSGKVDVIAVAAEFNNAQLILNSADDITGGGTVEPSDEISIQSIQDRFYDLGADQAQSGFITGIVISDRNTGQVNSRNIFVQKDDYGILVRFTGDHSFNLGDQLKIDVSSEEVSEFRGLLQINNVPLSNASKTGTAELPAPVELTVDQILNNNNRYESTRVIIKDATLSGGATYGVGNISVNDGTNSINIFTFSSTSYANDPVPSGVVDVIGIVSQYDENPQIVLNSSDDVM